MERKGVGKKGKGGVGTRCVVPWSQQTLDGAGIMFTGWKNGIENSKGRREGGGAGYGAACMTQHSGWLGGGAALGCSRGGGASLGGGFNRTICDSLSSASGPDS